MIIQQHNSKTFLKSRTPSQISSRHNKNNSHRIKEPIDTPNESQLLHQKRLRSENLIKNFTELLESSTPCDIEKIKKSLETKLGTQPTIQSNNELLYCHQCFSIEFVGKMITCSNEHCKKKFCCDCFKKYHVNHLEQINFNLTNGNWICFDCLMNQQKNTTVNNENEKHLEEEVKGKELIKSICENYYMNKSLMQGDDYIKKKCRYCKSRAFHSNELLHFSSIHNFLEYIDYLFRCQLPLITYDHKEILINKEVISQYIGKVNKYNNEWLFSFAKALCKGCLLMILNKRNCIMILKSVLKDPEPSTNTINMNQIATQSLITPHYGIKSVPSSEKTESIVLLKQPDQSPSVILPTQMTLLSKKVKDFNKEAATLNNNMLRIIEKMNKGAMLFNRLYKNDPINSDNLQEYFNKIVAINYKNRQKSNVIFSSFNNHKNFLYSIIEYGNQYLTSSNCRKAPDYFNYHLKIQMTQFENEFNHYGNIIVGYAQAFHSLQSLTQEYIDSLTFQSKLFDIELNKD